MPAPHSTPSNSGVAQHSRENQWLFPRSLVDCPLKGNQNRPMSLSLLPLSYCTNVHPGRSVAEVENGLDRFTVPIRQHFGKPLAAGLWLAKPVVDELLATSDGVRRFADGLARRGLTCHTLNAFLSAIFVAWVKENVYLPDWSTEERLTYTSYARVLAASFAGDCRWEYFDVAPGPCRRRHPPISIAPLSNW